MRHIQTNILYRRLKSGQTESYFCGVFLILNCPLWHATMYDRDIHIHTPKLKCMRNFTHGYFIVFTMRNSKNNKITIGEKNDKHPEIMKAKSVPRKCNYMEDI